MSSDTTQPPDSASNPAVSDGESGTGSNSSEGSGTDQDAGTKTSSTAVDGTDDTTSEPGGGTDAVNAAEDLAPSIRAHRDHMLAPLRKLSVNLLETYRHINQVYYEERKERKKAWDDKHDNYIIKPGEIFNDRFEFKSQIGKGSFGVVAYAHDREKKCDVAIKIIKSQRPFAKQAETEIKLLEFMRDANSDDRYGIVRLLEHFKHRSHVCLVFEMLDHNLYEVIKKTDFRGLSLKVVKHFGFQLLEALQFLRSEGVRIIHCDLKPENILLCPDLKSSQIKIIDFGSSCFYTEKMYEYIQSRFYRSPEVLLGLPYDEAIDMWSLGCILFELHTGFPLFGGQSEEQQMQYICSLLGLPPRQMLLDAKPAKLAKMFVTVEGPPSDVPLPGDKRSVDGKRSEGEISADIAAAAASRSDSDSSTGHADPNADGSEGGGATKVTGYRLKHPKSPTTLAAKLRLEKGGLANWRTTPQKAQEIYAPFIDLLEKILTYSPTARIHPTVALTHPFITTFDDVDSGDASSGSDQ